VKVHDANPHKRNSLYNYHPGSGGTLAKHRKGEVHMRASWIFSKNDVIANLAVIIAGLLVTILQSQLPDLIIGLAIAILVLRGGVQILKEARGEKALS
jgi:Co/Zn/Cd efflux system component